MTAAARDRHETRMRRVLDHIGRHLDVPLDLATLAGVAASSPLHFHRQFGDAITDLHLPLR